MNGFYFPLNEKPLSDKLKGFAGFQFLGNDNFKGNLDAKHRGILFN